MQRTIFDQPEIVCIGVDPGKNGGLTAITIDGEMIESIAMPKTELKIARWFNRWKPTQDLDVCACIELVHAYPGKPIKRKCSRCGFMTNDTVSQGVSSAFTFGENYGFLRSCLIANDIWIIDCPAVHPKVWQKNCGILPKSKEESKTDWKNRLKNRALELFPSEKVTLAKSDSILIAVYCQKRRKEIQ